MNRYWSTLLLLLVVVLLSTSASAQVINYAAGKSVSRWASLANTSLNTGKNAVATILTNGLTNDFVRLGPSPASAVYQGAGYVLPAGQTMKLAAIEFVNGPWDGDGDGACGGKLGAQYTLNGVDWIETGWIPPSNYPYSSPSAAWQTFVISGPVPIDVRGGRVTCEVRTNNGGSFYVNMAEVRLLSPTGAVKPTLTFTASKTSISPTEISRLTWNSLGSVSCDASGAWSGLKTTSGFFDVSPGVPGTFVYTLRCLNGQGGGYSDYVSVTLTVTAAQVGTLTPEPTFYNFGDIHVGDYKETPITLRNTGTASLTVSQVAVPSPFGTATPSLPYTIPPGGTWTFTAFFVPTTASTNPVSLPIVVTHTGSNSPTAVQLTGRGVNTVTQVGLAWDPVAEATGYKIYSSGTDGGPYTIAMDCGNVTSCYVPLTGPTYFVVRAYDATRESGNSNQVFSQ